MGNSCVNRIQHRKLHWNTLGQMCCSFPAGVLTPLLESLSHMPQTQYRQGDLLFILQETRPTTELIEQPGPVIVMGEATGHAHRMVGGTILEDPTVGALYLDLQDTGRVTHEEHDALTLGPGLWLVVRQREYTPEAIRLVRD
jgi:hypothetical protein